VQMLAEQAGLKLIDVELNDVNGGSFAVTAAKKTSRRQPRPSVSQTLQQEMEFGLNDPATYARFSNAVHQHGARRARYRGTPKTGAQYLWLVSAINLKRAAAWLMRGRIYFRWVLCCIRWQRGVCHLRATLRR